MTEKDKKAGKKSAGSSAAPREQDVAVNRKARHDYEVLSRYEAGIALVGSEVKALRAGRAQLRDSYAAIEDGQLWLRNVHISEYQASSYFAPEPRRTRRLLMHRKEIDRLSVQVNERGLTLVPLRIYFVRGRAKVELGLCRGRKAYDKREAIRERDMQRDVDVELRRRP
jgi:SsrA-binding protein